MDVSLATGLAAYASAVAWWVSGAVVYELVAPEDITIALPVFLSSSFALIVSTWVAASIWFKRQRRVDDMSKEMERLRDRCERLENK